MSQGGAGKRNVAFIQGDEPKFLQEFKQRAGYLSGPALEEKFLGGKVPEKPGAEDSGSEEEDNLVKRRRRGFSPTSRFEEKSEKRPESPGVEREDELPLVVTADGKDVVSEDRSDDDKDGTMFELAGQSKIGGKEMTRSLDALYGNSNKAANRGTETTDVEKLVASGGKFVFKKRSDDHSKQEDNDLVATTSNNPSHEKSQSNPAKKKSESRAISDRKLLSFDILDD